MAIIKIKFENPINVSAQVHDYIYAIAPGATTVLSSNLVGRISSIPNTKQIDVNDTTGTYNPTDGDFIMFQKDNQANLSSLGGYYAEVKFETPTSLTSKVELFAIGSEITLSSK